MSNQNLADVKASKGKKMFLLLVLVFVLPFTIALTLHLLDIRPSGKSFGHLITPVVALEIPTFNDAKDVRFSGEQWSKIWNIVMVAEAGCNKACEQNVDKLNRVQRSLNKEKHRVQRILILKNTFDAEKISQLQEKFPQLIVLTVEEASQEQFIATFEQVAPQGSIYLVDPLNNLMMHYPDVESKELRSDVMRLLKNSWGG
ncbi:MAG: cytochrome oxidase Cu insertion factor (SCO1/SenC/PrrC family) [Methylophilaceae bacterium]|jgi:cytochrome oxidase Cu insertion factor (SCO1/SenC/PrrC family)